MIRVTRTTKFILPDRRIMIYDNDRSLKAEDPLRKPGLFCLKDHLNQNFLISLRPIHLLAALLPIRLGLPELSVETSFEILASLYNCDTIPIYFTPLR